MEHWTDNAVNLLSLNIYNQCVNPNANFFLIGVINDQTRVATYRISSPSPEQTNNTNLDPTNAVVLGLRWQGTMIVDGTSEVTYTQYPNPVTQNYVYFKE